MTSVICLEKLTFTLMKFKYDSYCRPDKYAAMCVDARQELDLKIGVAFSRLMTKAYLDMAREKFRLKDQKVNDSIFIDGSIIMRNLKFKVVSFGPCQTPTLWFCVQRHKEISNFRPEEYFTVRVRATLGGKEVDLTWADGERVTSREEVGRMEEAVRKASTQQSGTIARLEEEVKRQRRPQALNTVTLLKAASKGLGMSPTAAMSAAEHLYTSGYISYPRTETSAYPPTFDLHAVLMEQANHPAWGRAAQYLLQSGRIDRPEGGEIKLLPDLSCLMVANDHQPICRERCRRPPPHHSNASSAQRRDQQRQ